MPKGGWVTKIKRPTDVPKKKPQATWPIGEELVGFEALTPSQAAVSAPLSAALQRLVAAPGGPTFQPAAAAAFSPYGGAVGGALQSAMVTALRGEPVTGVTSPYEGAVGRAMEAALLTALRGEVPTEAFEAGVARPARRTFAEETAPAIREEFAGPGTFWGTARAGEVTGRRERMETGLGEQRARMVEGALQRALGAVGPAFAAQRFGVEMPLQLKETAQQRALAAVGPALTAQQSAIRLAFEDYVRRNPAASEALQAALSYLGIPMLATYQPYE